MNELVQVVSRAGLDALLEHIHASFILVESDGSFSAWNSAFNPIRAAFPNAGRLEEFIPNEEKVEFRRRLKNTCKAESSSHWVTDLITDERGSQVCCNCMLLPIPGGRALFIAERVAVDPSISEIIERMRRQVKLFRVESEHAKKLVLNKHAELEAVMAQAQEVSNIDELTFLPNRRQVIRELQNEVLRAERYNSMLSISILDIDHFKLVNDTYGHMVGDQVLRAIAVKLRDQVRHPDLVARYGGEEFLILLPNSPKEAAMEQAARLCKQIRDAIIQVDEHAIRVTISIGVAQFKNGVDNWHTLLSRADTAMYDAKHAGRDQWAVSE